MGNQDGEIFVLAHAVNGQHEFLNEAEQNSEQEELRPTTSE
jgi:hypothetical protein